MKYEFEGKRKGDKRERGKRKGDKREKGRR